MTSNDSSALGHVMSVRVLVATTLALLVLTGVTVAVARIDLGGANVLVALLLAAIKVSLVATFFMHLRHDRRFSLVVFASAIFFAVLLTGFVLVDSVEYQPDIAAKLEAD